jgi:hypothetical protein
MAHNKAQSWLFILCALEGIAAAIKIFLIPSEGGSLSPVRMVLIAVPLIMAAAWIFAAVRYSGKLDRLARPGFIAGFAILALVFSTLLFLLRYYDPGRYLSAYERLSPLLWYFLLICLQFSLYLLFLYAGFHPGELSFRRPVYSYTLIVFIVLLLIFALIAVTRLGVTFDPAYWGEPGVPLMGWQFGLALIGGLIVLCIGLYARSSTLDLILPIGLYLLTLLICLSVPNSVLKNSYYMPIVQSETQPFPYSDSAYYDQMAQSLLIGHPYQGVIPTRPLYILFLTVLHLFFGQDYARIIAAQTVVLAFLPVLLFYLGKKIHGRVAGVIVALFFIFREWTSLVISSETRVTNTKMLLVDLPTLFLLLVACLLVFRWLEKKRWLDAFLAGGMFGIVLLLRTQSLVILPFIVLIALLVLGWRNRSFYRDLAVFLIGVILSISPWLFHNYKLTGQVAFDADFQNKLLASMYLYGGNEAIQSMNMDHMSLPSLLIQSTLKDPTHVLGFISNHFLATQVDGVLALPLIEPYNGLKAPVNLYWMDWNGELSWYNLLLLVVYLAVISLGIGAAWHRWRWLGLLPLAFSLGYAVSTAVSRYSSWRYDFPADWIYYFYFGVGAAELLGQAAILFGAKREAVFEMDGITNTAPATHPVPKAAALAFLFLLIGSSPWMIEKLSAPRYPDQSVQTLQQELVALPDSPSAEEIQNFMSRPNSYLETGRLLYPRYYNKGDGLSSANPSPAFKVRDFARLGFVLLNQDLMPTVFPTKRFSKPVPQAADVIVLGCKQENYVEARLIAFPDTDTVYLDKPLSEPCTP